MAGSPGAPASVCVLSGDAHHAYVAEAHFDVPLRVRIFQLTCSPRLHNDVPWFMKIVFRLLWSAPAERLVRAMLGLVATAPPSSLQWSRVAGPHLGNDLAEFVAHGRRAETILRQSGAQRETRLREVARVSLT